MSASPVPPAVVLDGLVRRFGAVVAADAMTWHAPAGRLTAILGPNGAGKTTAVECAVGLQHADDGSVQVLGVDPWRSPDTHRGRVGVMLQSGGLPTGTTPVRLLHHLQSLYAGPPPGHLARLVQRLGIDRFASTTVRRLSGGQRQRVALAAALVGAPDVAFLDEPTAGLDPHARLDVYDLLEEVREAGTTLVVTTHSFEEADRLADHLVIVSAGRTVAEGSPAEVGAGRSLEDVYFGLTRRVS